MIIEAKCKFCQKSLSLVIDDEYAALGDPYGLVKLAACDGCSDYMTSRRKIFDQIKRAAMNHLGGAYDKEQIPKLREKLTALVQRYMRLISDFRSCPMPDWDNSIVDDMLATPGNYALILQMVPRMFAQPSLV